MFSEPLNDIMRRRSRDAAGRAWTCAAVAMLIAVAVAGCGGSSKPGYCSDRSNLESSIKNLPSATSTNGISSLPSQIATIKSDATSLVSSAKSDFPTETSAVKSSVDALESTVKGLPASPSARQIAAVATGAASVVSSVKSFSSATKSKCD